MCPPPPSAASAPPRPSEAPTGRILVGTQGFGYDAWEGLVYPRGLRPVDRLATYARAFPVVELDRTFYGLPRRAEVDRWVATTPPGFLFTAKAPRVATHDLRLRGPEAVRHVADLVGALDPLGDRLAAILLQMGPGFRYPLDFAALDDALDALPGIVPRTTRIAVEFRHPSWLDAPGIEDRLRGAGVAWVWNDWSPGANPWAPMPRAIDDPRAFRSTADHAYVRLTGDHDLEVDFRNVIIDRGADMRRWADLIRQWQEAQARAGRGGDAFVFLNNHYSGSSPRTAGALRQVLGLPDLVLEGDGFAPSARMGSSAIRLPGL